MFFASIIGFVVCPTLLLCMGPFRALKLHACFSFFAPSASRCRACSSLWRLWPLVKTQRGDGWSVKYKFRLNLAMPGLCLGYACGACFRNLGGDPRQMIISSLWSASTTPSAPGNRSKGHRTHREYHELEKSCCAPTAPGN